MIINIKDLKSELREIDQYLSVGSFDDDEDTIAELDKTSPYIGEILVSFSNLEHTLELAIAGLQSDRSDEPGIFLLNFLEDNRIKIDYFTEIARLHILHSDLIKNKDRMRFIVDLKEITKKLAYVAEVRNVIAHSKWSTITKKYMVVNSTKLNKTSGRVEVKMYHLNPRTLRQLVTGINRTNEELWKFIDDKLHLR